MLFFHRSIKNRDGDSKSDFKINLDDQDSITLAEDDEDGKVDQNDESFYQMIQVLKKGLGMTKKCYNQISINK